MRFPGFCKLAGQAVLWKKNGFLGYKVWKNRCDPRRDWTLPVDNQIVDKP